MDKLTFFRGLLFALRARREDFDADAAVFHKAFASTVDLARTSPPEGVSVDLSLEMDPVFGVYPEANEMLLEGEQDLLISLMNPRFQKAHFKISEDEAAAELNELPVPQWFLMLGEHLDAQLNLVAK